MEYDPFRIPVADLTAEILVSALGAVSEGWFVEYKSALPKKAGDIARSIAALANTRGGWLFYGISAPSNSPGIPQGFPAIPTDEVPQAISRIRDSVKEHLSPGPYFEIHPLKGDGTAFPSDRAIVMVKVPLGPKPPYLHSSGVVYQRVADSCEPARLSDRSHLDDLFRRSRLATKDLQGFFKRRPVQFEKEPYAQFFLLPDPYDVHGWRHRINFERFAELMNPPRTEAAQTLIEGISMPFLHCQTLNSAFVARQVGGMTWRFDRMGRHVINAPLPYANAVHQVSLLKFLDGYDHSKAFTELWESASFRPSRIIDLTLWAAMVLSISKQIQRLKRECGFEGYDGRLHCMVKLHNLGLSAPFIDTTHFINHAKAFGMPMTHDGDMSIPSSDADGLAELWSSNQDDEGAYIGDAGLLLLMIAGAMGLPWSEHFYNPNSEAELKRRPLGHFVADWIQAVPRALEVLELRSKKW